MNKNIVTTLIAGTFFAASLVAPAFATDNAASTAEIASQRPVDLPNLPDLKLPERLPTLDQLTERLKNLDIGAVLERDDIREKLPKSIDLPDIKGLPPSVDLPVLKPVTVPKSVDLPKLDPVILPELQPAPIPVKAAPIDELETDEVPTSRAPVKDIVNATKAEKAGILAAHDGDRRAAKAELKAAQMRMVAQIKANNGAQRGKGKSKR